MTLNIDSLVALSVMGEIAHPTVKQSYRIAPSTGQPVILPSVGGISYNAHLGDPAVDIQADHIEPGVSIRHPHDASNRALNTYACIGNTVRVVSGDAKGLTGWVTGKHGGVEHVMVHFDNPADLDRLTIGDRMQLKAFGVGLILPNHPDLTVMNLDPAVFSTLATSDSQTVTVPVTHQVPAVLLGAGLGKETCYSGDADIQLNDSDTVAQYNLNTLRFGDIVAMLDTDHRYGRIYRPGWVSIGIIAHSCSVQAGHGPGVTTILTGPADNLKIQLDADANLKRFLPSL